jgi:hypothetical protein
VTEGLYKVRVKDGKLDFERVFDDKDKDKTKLEKLNSLAYFFHYHLSLEAGKHEEWQNLKDETLDSAFRKGYVAALDKTLKEFEDLAKSLDINL